MDTATTSWRRLSDEPQRHAAVYSSCGDQAPAVPVNEVQQEAAWENEGGQSTLQTEPVRILIVDDDIESSTSLEIMLRASG